MAQRPLFLPQAEGELLVRTVSVEFEWFAGMAVSQKQKSIAALHQAAKQLPGVVRVLEVSSKSPEPLGVALSAFNLTFTTRRQARTLTVESAFQASKVFENAGPFTDLLDAPPRDAKRDERLLNSGRLIGFRFFGTDWTLEPQTAFYDWLYINALRSRAELAAQVLAYSAFTDIEFNPRKSINCQAYALALFVALDQRGLLEKATASRTAFLEIVGRPVSNTREDASVQPSLLSGLL